MLALGTLLDRARRRIITSGGGGWTVLIILTTVAHAYTGNIPLGFLAFGLVMIVQVALRGPDDKFTRACQLIDMAMQMVDEDERRLLVAFELADDETRRRALDAMQRAGVSDTVEATETTSGD